MPNPTQEDREVSVTCALADDVLLFQRMTGSDELGRLSEYRVQLLSTSNDVKIADVLGKAMGIHVDLPDGSLRHYNGIVTRFCSTGTKGKLASYEATIHPWLWLLTRSSNCRIFQDMSVIEIVKEVCKASVYGGLTDLSDGALSGTYDKLPYCVQYRESDFNFVCRLLESAGIYFFFTHDASRHTMVLADSSGAHAKIAGYGNVGFTEQGGRNPVDRESVFAWSAAGAVVASSYTLNDFDFEKASGSLSGGLLSKTTIAAAFEQPAYELFDYPGKYVSAADGTALSRGRMEGVHGKSEQIDAQTHARGLFPGGLFTLAEHPRDDQNREYLVTQARYDIVGDSYGSGGAATPMSFDCSFSAIGHDHSFRPLPIAIKPFVQGPQTAIVVGKANEEIWTDQYGRVKVQFHWDRLGKEDEKSSCWVRVSQSWAGKGWGTIFIPRIGMEVIVSFLEGDPDRPLVTGCVYNSDAMPPYDLPAEQTRTTTKTNTSKGGAGFNEIRLDDKKDAEEIFIQAEKDFNRVVKNNDTLKVGFEKKDKGDQTITIKNDQSLSVGNDQTIKIAHDQTATIDNDQTVKIKVDQKLDVGGNQTVAITGDQKITVSKTIVIEATMSIELKVGGSSILIEPAKITIKSAQIDVEADAAMKIKAGAMMEIKAGAVMTVAGALVKIN